jgi:hypothetical protein
MSKATDARETEDTFRSANWDIVEVARDIAVGGLVPFLCECSDPSCRTVLRIRWPEYADIHEHPYRYVVAPGHELLEVEQLVAERGGYSVVEK